MRARFELAPSVAHSLFGELTDGHCRWCTERFGVQRQVVRGAVVESQMSSTAALVSFVAAPPLIGARAALDQSAATAKVKVRQWRQWRGSCVLQIEFARTTVAQRAARLKPSRFEPSRAESDPTEPLESRSLEAALPQSAPALAAPLPPQAAGSAPNGPHQYFARAKLRGVAAA